MRCSELQTVTVNVTVTKSFVLRRLLGDRGRITKQSAFCFLVSIGRQEQNVFGWRLKLIVDRVYGCH